MYVLNVSVWLRSFYLYRVQKFLHIKFRYSEKQNILKIKLVCDITENMKRYMNNEYGCTVNK